MEQKKRKCCKCKEEKPLTKDYFTKDKNDPTGFTYQCKICRSKHHKKWSLENPEKIKEINFRNKDKRKAFYNSPEGKLSSRRSWLKKSYGLSIEKYEQILTSQNNKCAICDSEHTYDRFGVLAVDHCHSTGKIRGLLCYRCNVGLGNFSDDIKKLEKAIEYLKNNNNDN